MIKSITPTLVIFCWLLTWGRLHCAYLDRQWPHLGLCKLVLYGDIWRNRSGHPKGGGGVTGLLKWKARNVLPGESNVHTVFSLQTGNWKWNFAHVFFVPFCEDLAGVFCVVMFCFFAWVFVSQDFLENVDHVRPPLRKIKSWSCFSSRSSLSYYVVKSFFSRRAQSRPSWWKKRFELSCRAFHRWNLSVATGVDCQLFPEQSENQHLLQHNTHFAIILARYMENNGVFHVLDESYPALKIKLCAPFFGNG